MLKRRGVREFGGLLILFILLIAFSTFYEQIGQERVASDAPTTMNTKSEGVRALYLLYAREGIRTEALKGPWSDLGTSDGLLVFVEPPDEDRPIELNDIKTLERWVRDGGTFLDLVSDPPVEQPPNPADGVEGDSGATAGDPSLHEVLVDSGTGSPLLAGVQSLSVSSRQRLTIAKNGKYTVLAHDSGGPIAMVKSLGRGHVVIVANRYGATNAGIAQADNALFLVNIARSAIGGSGRTVLFDEYHHGVGFAEKTTARNGSLWSSLPLALRMATIYLALVALLLVYNGNRRFGPTRVTPPVSLRASTDYVNSMARLYRRAGAADIAFEMLYTRFVRDLKRALDAPTDAGAAYLTRAAEQKFGPSASGLQELLVRGEAVIAGQRLTEPDMLNLAKQIEQLRKGCQLVGV